MKNFRKGIVGAVAAVVLAGGLVACGSEGSGSTSSEDRVASAVESGALPVTVTHKFGSTQVKEAPRRVVSLGYNDQDFLLALGVTPVAVRDWDGMLPEGEAAGAWASDKISGPKPEIYSSEEIKPEAVAAMKPDLIVAVYSGIDRNTYDALSKIAPVIAQTGDFDDYQQPWDVTTREVGQALGRPAAAGRLVDGINEKFATLAASHPEWKGKTVTNATYDGKDLSAFAAKDMRLHFFSQLGMVPNKAVDAAAKGNFYAKLSLEEAPRLDSDVLVWDQLSYAPKGAETITSQPALAALPAMKEKRAIYLEGELEKAFGFQTVLSLTYVLDNIEKPLESVITR